MLNKFAILIVVFIGIFSMSFNAVSATTIQPGIMCVEINTSGPRLITSGGGVYNPSTSWLDVDCPVVRTDFDGDPFHTAEVEQSSIQVIDQNEMDTVYCKLQYFSIPIGEGGRPIIWNATPPQYSVHGANPHAEQLETGRLHLGNNNNAHLFFRCGIPPIEEDGRRSGILSYRVEQ